ncbi:MAG: glycyl-radical enzyme activating protein [Clostridia bacterium]|nr:glycyl-radical enzyme activating protein [Clostridia bacterium]
MEGRIINITRFCTDDGPGIRTTVFFKGCPLRCLWCHNPESQRFECEAWENGEAVGRTATVEEVLSEIREDEIFYRTSGGGATLSGGEPMAQPDFAEGILSGCRTAGIRTAMETCGFAAPAVAERLFPLCDLLLFDLKETDPARHEDFTGVPLAPILENLRRADALGIPVCLRLPIIPGLNDREEHFRAVRAIADSLTHPPQLQIMPYHRLGEHKYDRLGREYLCPETHEPTAEEKARWEKWLHI